MSNVLDSLFLIKLFFFIQMSIVRELHIWQIKNYTKKIFRNQILLSCVLQINKSMFKAP